MSPTSHSVPAIQACIIAALAAHGLMAQTAAPPEDNNRATAVTPDSHAYVPMTQAERFRAYMRHLFSAEAFLRSAAGAGINQALGIPHEWNQGGVGYAQRLASSYAAHAIQSTVMYFASTALEEDDRYCRSGETGFRPRFKYAIASSLWARHNDGTRHFSWSRISSYVAEAAVSRAWQPPSTRGPIHAVNCFAIALGAEAGFNVAREFLPRIFHTLPAVPRGSQP